MKKNIKKLIPLALIAAVLAVPTVNAMAEYNPDKEVSASEISTKSIESKNSVIVNGELVENAETILSDGRLMFPARPVFEALGYEVKWDAENKRVEIVNLPQYVTFIIGTDGYTFARTAPMLLEKAPELINGSTYVPLELLTEIMALTAETDENQNIIITENVLETETASDTETKSDTETESETKTEETTASDETIESTETSDAGIENDKANAKVISLDNFSILVSDIEKGEVILNVSNDTDILSEYGEKLSFADIKEDSELFIEYGEAMTMSIPPMNNPEKIVILK